MSLDTFRAKVFNLIPMAITGKKIGEPNIGKDCADDILKWLKDNHFTDMEIQGMKLFIDFIFGNNTDELIKNLAEQIGEDL
jgi:hypothetical protein